MIKTNLDFGNSSLSIEDAISFAKEKEIKSLIVCDENLYSTPKFYRLCKQANIKPIISVDRVVNGVHMMIGCKNFNGYKKLSSLVSKGIDVKKLNDPELFTVIYNADTKDSFTKILPVLPNACIGVYNYTNESRKKMVNFMHARKGERKVVPFSLATMITPDDIDKNQLLSAIVNKKMLQDVPPLSDIHALSIPSGKKEWIVSLDELKHECIADYPFDDPTPPIYPFVEDDVEELMLKNVHTEHELLTVLANIGLDERLVDIPEEKHNEYRARLEMELRVFEETKFSGYALIVRDYVSAAREMGITVGPGRGSSVGSLLGWALRLTDIDPIFYGLLFERFLNPERIGLPDWDTDFSQIERKRVIAYIVSRYGEDCVAQVVSFGSIGARGAIKDVARCMGYPLNKAETLSKMLSSVAGASLLESYSDNQKKIDKYLSWDMRAQRVWDGALLIEGQYKNTGTHASAMVVSEVPIAEKVPTIELKGTRVSQFCGDDIEYAGLIKCDILGLKRLSLQDAALDMIYENYGERINLGSIPYDDDKVFSMISQGNTLGLFQIESEGMQDLARKIRPDKIEDIIALNALFRPGPRNSGMVESYINRKNGEEEITFFSPSFEEVLRPILGNTYGVIVYQEQVMQIVRAVAGFSFGKADIIRRGMGKKKKSDIEALSDLFVSGAVEKGYEEKEAGELFEHIKKFAGYGFNKSHSAAYAIATYRDGWLKAHYPAEFMSSILNFEGNNLKKSLYIQDMKNNLGLTILPPDINTSHNRFGTKDGKTVHFSLSTLKGIGLGSKDILAARDGRDASAVLQSSGLFGSIEQETAEVGEFTSLDNFKSRVPGINHRVMTSLVCAGCFDSISPNRKASLLDTYTEIEDFSLSDKLSQELDILGFYITDPFEKVKKYTRPFDIPLLSEAPDGICHLLVLPREAEILSSKKTGDKYASFNTFYSGETRKIMVFKEGLELLPDLDTSRPAILQVRKNEDTVVLLDVLKFSTANLAKCFPLKVDAEEKSVDIKKRPLCDIDENHIGKTIVPPQ